MYPTTNRNRNTKKEEKMLKEGNMTSSISQKRGQNFFKLCINKLRLFMCKSVSEVLQTHSDTVLNRITLTSAPHWRKVPPSWDCLWFRARRTFLLVTGELPQVAWECQTHSGQLHRFLMVKMVTRKNNLRSCGDCTPTQLPITAPVIWKAKAVV